MFRRKSTGPLQAVHLADRLAALGFILEEQDFVPEGLSILATEGGFVVVGYVPKMDGPYPVLGERTLEVTKLMIDEAYTRHRRE